MKSEIYYFSGTGNSYFVAREIARVTHSTLIPIPAVIEQPGSITSANTIGIVFPAYLAQLSGIPLMVERFIDKLDDIGSKTLFTVCTCGGLENFNALPTLKNLSKKIRSRGGKLSAEYSVRLPMNNLKYPPYISHDHDVIFSQAEKTIADISRRILQGKREKNHLRKQILNLTMTPLYRLLKNLYITDLKKKANVPDNLPMDYHELIPLTDRGITVDENCNGCGICVRVCPAGNISLVNDKPVWNNHCEMCMACDEWCPERAIRHWNKVPGNNYHHPAVKRAEMIYKKFE